MVGLYGAAVGGGTDGSTLVHCLFLPVPVTPLGALPLPALQLCHAVQLAKLKEGAEALRYVRAQILQVLLSVL